MDPCGLVGVASALTTMLTSLAKPLKYQIPCMKGNYFPVSKAAQMKSILFYAE